MTLTAEQVEARPSLVQMARAEYDGLSRVNFSTLKAFDRSPLHYRHALAERSPDTAARKLGRATHVAVLEPDRFKEDVVCWREGTRRGKAWDAYREAHAGQEILTAKEMETCLAIAKSVRGNPEAMRYLKAGRAEVTALWNDAVSGWPCRGRLDWIANVGALADLKTTKDASLSGFVRQAWTSLYHAQGAMYQDAVFAATGERLPFIILAVENVAPYCCQVYALGQDAIDAGRKAYRGWLARLTECRLSGEWPGYATGPVELQVPRWADRTGESAEDEETEDEETEDEETTEE